LRGRSRRFAGLAGLAGLAAAGIAVLVAASPAWAADPPLVSLGLGTADIMGGGARTGADMRLEYRSGLSLAPYFEDIVKVKPWVGLEGTTRGALWAGGGIWLDIPFGRHWVLSPSIGAGYYDDAHGHNLGSVFEIRSQLEGGYVFDNGMRLVASFDHMSNGGITRHNPGLETAMISIQVPLRSLFGL
jgi:lipid A 3-O-deacylase